MEEQKEFLELHSSKIPTPIEILKSIKQDYTLYKHVKLQMSKPSVRTKIGHAVSYVKEFYKGQVYKIEDLYKDSSVACKFKGTTGSIWNKQNTINNPDFPHRSNLYATFGNLPALLLAMSPYWFSDDPDVLFKFFVHKFGQPTKTQKYNYWQDKSAARWEIAGFCLLNKIELLETINFNGSKKPICALLSTPDVKGSTSKMLKKYFPEYSHLVPIDADVDDCYVYLKKGHLIQSPSYRIGKIGISNSVQSRNDYFRRQGINFDLVDEIGPFSLKDAKRHERMLLDIVNGITPVGRANFNFEFDGCTECWSLNGFDPLSFADIIKRDSNRIIQTMPELTADALPEWDL